MEGFRRDAVRNKAQILDAARRALAAGEGLALNSVAREAGVGVGTVYRHFSSVAELEETLVWERFDELNDALSQVRESGIDPALRLFFDLLTEDALFEEVVSRAEPVLEQTTRRKASLVRLLETLVAHAQEDRAVRSDVTARDILVAVCGVSHAARTDGIRPGSARARTLLNIVLDGLRSNGGVPAPGE